MYFLTLDIIRISYIKTILRRDHHAPPTPSRGSILREHGHVDHLSVSKYGC